jgi:hypothetical protein
LQSARTDTTTIGVNAWLRAAINIFEVLSKNGKTTVSVG